MSPTIVVELFTRPGCCLCDEAKAVLEAARGEHPFLLRTINIDDDPELKARYGTEIPVVHIGGRKAFKYRVDPAELRRRLARAASAGSG